MVEPISLSTTIALLVHHAPEWLSSIQGVFLDNGKEFAIDKGKDSAIDKTPRSERRLLEEKAQLRHLELCLKNAAERGLVTFHTVEERDQYRSVLTILTEKSSSAEALRNEVMRLFALTDSPNLAVLTEKYSLLQRIRAIAKNESHKEVDATIYLKSFFEALIAELYNDSLFHERMSHALQVRAAVGMQRSLEEVVTTLRQIGEAGADHYTAQQFEQDIQEYIAYVERTLRYVKVVGIIPKDRGDESPNPELDAIFIPMHVILQDQTIPKDQAQDSIVTLLERFPHLVLLGGPGSGKTTITRYLAWSHVVANSPTSSASLSNTPLLSRKPLPLRFELRRLAEDRRQRPFSFLSYATEVLLGRSGIRIATQMFEELLERRAMLVLFDGLDEVATLDERQRMVEEIEDFAQRYPGNYILVTSRPIGYEYTRFSHRWFSHALVQEFDPQQVRMFLERWYANVLKLSPLSTEDQQELENLYILLTENQRLHMFTTNPLLFTVITALHRYERLPDRRVLLYDRCADLLLDTWSKLRGTDLRWRDMKMGKEDQYACVAHLGLVLQKRSQQKEEDTTGTRVSRETSTSWNFADEVSTKFLLREIEHFLAIQNLLPTLAERRAEAKRFLALIQVEAGLIIEIGTDENGGTLYGFVNRAFQEYFAAADIYERYLQEEDPTIISQFLADHLHDPHWREVILLLFGKLKRKTATIQLRYILEGKFKSLHSRYNDLIQQDIFFICTCLDEEITVENDLAENIISLIIKLIKNSAFLSQRSEALEALVSLMRTRQYSSLARKALTTLIEQDIIPDISTRIRTAQIFSEYSSGRLQEQQQALQMLLDLARRPELTFEEAVQVARVLYESSPTESEEEQQALQMLLDLAQNQNITIEQQLEIATLPLTVDKDNFKDRAMAVRTVQTMLHLDNAEQNLEKYWQPRDVNNKGETSDIPFLIKLAKQETLPTKMRNEIYKILHEMVPQFGSVEDYSS